LTAKPARFRAARLSASVLRPRSARASSARLYILDEPTIGLHQRDNDKLIKTLHELRDLGNTIIVVEHDEDTIRASDYLVDVGPGCGYPRRQDRGHGPGPEIFKDPKKNSLTLDFLRGKKKIAIPEERRRVTRETPVLRIKGASANNLDNIGRRNTNRPFHCGNRSFRFR
jgi:excinuclease ABC subunit A